MKPIAVAGLTALLLTGCSASTSGGPIDASNESRSLAAHIETEYSDYLRDYIHVYLGYASCSYAFIDEDVLNSLADDVLRDMAGRGADLVREEHHDALSDDAVEYAASLAVLTTVEMWANAITAELAPSYAEGVVDCSSTQESNQRRYESLQRFRAR